MKKLILLLLTALLLALPAWAEGPEETHILTTPDGLSVTHTVNGSPYRLYSDAELLMQHYCTMGEYDKAFVLNEQLSALGDAKATYRLGCHYLSGQGVSRDETAALDCFTTAKDAGRPGADPHEAQRLGYPPGYPGRNGGADRLCPGGPVPA